MKLVSVAGLSFRKAALECGVLDCRGHPGGRPPGGHRLRRGDPYEQDVLTGFTLTSRLALRQWIAGWGMCQVRSREGGDASEHDVKGSRVSEAPDQEGHGFRECRIWGTLVGTKHRENRGRQGRRRSSWGVHERRRVAGRNLKRERNHTGSMGDAGGAAGQSQAGQQRPARHTRRGTREHCGLPEAARRC